ncbi:unnamed protein product [Ilex paraguariensis]|uniref:USP domain-containing protein n=1 Tax=Ilex paraguariensis TaxID=185542 RepID=A0ABC8RZK1_9AQUA
MGGTSNLKASKLEENESSGYSVETEGEQRAKPVETSPEVPTCSNASRLGLPHGKDDIQTVCLADDKGTNLTGHLLPKGFSASATSSESSVDASVSDSNDSDRSDEHQSTNVSLEKFDSICENIKQTKPPFSKHPLWASSVDSFIRSGKVNQIKPNCIDGDSQCGSSSSSGWSVGGSHESSFSEPSTSSSGFWDGTLESSRSRNDALDGSVLFSSNEAGDGNAVSAMDHRSSSFDLAGNAVSAVDVQGFGTKTSISENVQSIKSGSREPTDGIAKLKERSENGSKSRRSPSLSSKMSNHIDADILKSSEHRYSSCSASYAYPTSSAEGRSQIKDVSKVSPLPSLSAERSNYGVNNTSSTLHTLKSEEVRSLSSKPSDTHLSSTCGRHTVQNVQSGQIDPAYEGAACSSQFAGKYPNAGNGVKTSMRKVVDQLRASTLSRYYTLGTGSEIAGRYSNKGLFPYELFVKLYNWNKVELRPCGLTNCGNSCYANAVLQCLAFTPPLTAYFLQGLHSKACEKKEWCFTCEFEKLVLKAKDGSSPLTPIRILSQIQNVGSHLGNGREEDAHEFLKYAIEAMQSACLKEAGVSASGYLEESTLIGLTFGGYLRSKIKCMKCGGKSERYERMMDLTVEIEGNIGTLEEALRQFTGTEILDGENKYQCSRCKSYEKAKKKLTVLEAPNVLTIALKRFQLGKFGKLNKSIRFPEILDLAPYMSGTSDKSPVYRLFGVVVHLDVMNAAFSGHYVCYVKNIQNKWFQTDDSTVKAVELEKVLTKGAYMLLYARCSPRAPRVIRNLIIPRDPRYPKNPTSKSRSNSAGPWDDPLADSLGGHIPQGHAGVHMIQTSLEEDSSSDISSSFFSEAGSCSTESSNRDSTGIDDYFDQIFGDLGCNWNSPHRNSSDSDTSSSASSPSPMYSRRPHPANLDYNASRYPETSGSRIDSAEPAVDSGDLWARQPGWSSKVSVPYSYSDSTNLRKLVSSSSCRETDSNRLGSVYPFGNTKSGVCFRRSTSGRTD